MLADELVAMDEKAQFAWFCKNARVNRRVGGDVYWIRIGAGKLLTDPDTYDLRTKFNREVGKLRAAKTGEVRDARTPQAP